MRYAQSMSEHVSLDDLHARAVSLLHAAAHTEDDERKAANRALAETLIEIRSRIPRSKTDSEPDWLGQSGEYKALITRVYSDANVYNSERRRIQRAVGYHVNEIMHKQLSEENMDKLGLRKETLHQRKTARIKRQINLAEFIASDEPLTDNEVDTAAGVVSRIFDRMTPSQRGVVAARLRNTHRIPDELAPLIRASE